MCFMVLARIVGLQLLRLNVKQTNFALQSGAVYCTNLLLAGRIVSNKVKQRGAPMTMSALPVWT